MGKKTIYCARAFWLRGRALHGGVVHQFSTQDRALAGGNLLARESHGVAVYSLVGYPDVDLWEDPVLIRRLGLAPALGWTAHASRNLTA